MLYRAFRTARNLLLEALIIRSARKLGKRRLRATICLLDLMVARARIEPPTRGFSVLVNLRPGARRTT
jgi:hypothetical protein